MNTFIRHTDRTEKKTKQAMK